MGHKGHSQFSSFSEGDRSKCEEQEQVGKLKMQWPSEQRQGTVDRVKTGLLSGRVTTECDT